MLDYAAAFVNFSGAFPNILAINASGPSATDGTEFISDMINDSMWGVWQMMANHAGLTPTGVLESNTTSQIKEALWKGFGSAPGISTRWHLASAPSVTGHRCLPLNGQGILRANYVDLDAAVFVGADPVNAAVAAAGGAYYRADDAAGTIPNDVGVYLILPDYRGYTVRGLDVAAAVDPDGASRYLGDLQLDQFQGFQAGCSNDDSGARNTWMRATTRDKQLTSAAVVNFTDFQLNTGYQGNVAMVKPVDDGTNGAPRTGTESRMINRADNFVVWY